MASNERSNSPMHLGMTGQFSPEDIQELLGAMGDGHGDHHQQHAQDNQQRQVRHVGSGSEVVTSADSVAASFARAGNNLQYERSTSSSAGDPGSSGQPTVTTGTAPIAAQLPCEEAKAQARSERKRSREKQRRSDVNKQFADLTQLLQKIDAEDVNEEDIKNGTTSTRVTFNPSNRVDLIARTIILLERLHEANKRRKTEIGSLQQQLDEAKKAGEDTAAKLKEALLAPPGQPMNKQFMMMVPMMMDGSGAAQPMMMNPYMPQAAMPQAYMPAHPMATPVAAAATAPPAAAAAAPSTATNPTAPAQAATATPAVPAGTTMATATAAPGPAVPAQQGQAPQQPQPAQVATPQPGFPYMMPAPMAGGGYMMTMANPMAAAVPGQPMAMMAHPQAMHALPSAESQNGRQEQKDSSSPVSSGNLAHCA